MSGFDDIVKAARVLRANSVSTAFGSDYFVGILNPGAADDIMTFESPKARYRYAQWEPRFNAWLKRTRQTRPPAMQVGDFKCGWMPK